MLRPVTLFTGQWADLSLADVCKKAKGFGYDGVEIACWGDHFEVDRALKDKSYCKGRWEIVHKRNGLLCLAISNHLVGQAVCDRIDVRHKEILPPRVWGDGEPEGVRKRAAEEMKNTARAARRFFDAAPRDVKELLPRVVVNGFTGSGIWPMMYAFPPVLPHQIEEGYNEFAERWGPILDVFDREGVVFALEVHPTEIAFDTVTAEGALAALDERKTLGFNFDPSHFAYQGVDYCDFIRQLGDRIYHVHMKDVWWRDHPGPSGVFGGHLPFGHPDRFWEFRSLGRGRIDFEAIIRALDSVNYDGPLSVEWEDSGMAREHGAAEACAFVRKLQYVPGRATFDAAFAKEPTNRKERNRRLRR